MADVHRSRLARLLDGDPCRIDRDQSLPTIRRLRARRTRTLCAGLLGNRTGARISLGQRQLVVVGLLYAYFAWGQWKATSENAKIANKTLLLQFRPHLIVRHVGLLTEPDHMLLPNESGALQAIPIETVLILTNHGGTQGEIIAANITVRVFERPPRPSGCYGTETAASTI